MVRLLILKNICADSAILPQFIKATIWFLHNIAFWMLQFAMYGARNLEMSIRFSLRSRPSEQFHRPEMSQIKAVISLRTNVKLNFHKNVGCQ